MYIYIHSSSFKSVLFDFQNRFHDYEETRLLIDIENSSFTFLVLSKFYENKTVGIIKLNLTNIDYPLVTETSGIFQNFISANYKIFVIVYL
jgi:hypothetical protein